MKSSIAFTIELGMEVVSLELTDIFARAAFFGGIYMLGEIRECT